MNTRIHLKENWKDHAESSGDLDGHSTLILSNTVIRPNNPFVDFSQHNRQAMERFIESCRDVISLITISGNLPMSTHRVRGKYEHGKAEATLDVRELDSLELGDSTEYSLFVSSTEHDDAAELIDLIRSGKILPIESWDEKQITRPKRRPRRILRQPLTPTRFRLGRPRAA